MPDSNSLRKPDEPLVNELRKILCRAMYLLDAIQKKAEDDAVSLAQITRQTIARMKSEGFVNRILRMDPDVVQAFSERLLDPAHNYRPPHIILKDDLDTDASRMTSYRFCRRLRETAARIIEQEPYSQAGGHADMAINVR